MAVAGVNATLAEWLGTIDLDEVMAAWERGCPADGVLAAGPDLSLQVATVEAAVAALAEPYGFEEEIEDLAGAAEDLLHHVGAGGLATRQLLALGQALADIPGLNDQALRLEFDRRLRVVLGRLVLYVNVAALREVDRQARRDSLTGLRNLLGFKGETERLAEKNVRFSIVYIDVDGLKQVNDSVGHESGNDLLRRVASALAEACAGGEYAYRIGGDEYAYVSTVRDSDAVNLLMEQLSSPETPFSWGIATYPSDDPSLEAVVALADQRMYDRKEDRKADGE